MTLKVMTAEVDHENEQISTLFLLKMQTNVKNQLTTHYRYYFSQILYCNVYMLCTHYDYGINLYIQMSTKIDGCE
jgi:hypothetical protein